MIIERLYIKLNYFFIKNIIQPQRRKMNEAELFKCVYANGEYKDIINYSDKFCNYLLITENGGFYVGKSKGIKLRLAKHLKYWFNTDTPVLFIYILEQLDKNHGIKMPRRIFTHL